MDCKDLNQITVMLLWILTVTITAIAPIDLRCIVALTKHHQVDPSHTQLEGQAPVLIGMLLLPDIILEPMLGAISFIIVITTATISI